MITAFMFWLFVHYDLSGEFNYGLFFVMEMVTYILIAVAL